MNDERRMFRRQRVTVDQQRRCLIKDNWKDRLAHKPYRKCSFANCSKTKSRDRKLVNRQCWTDLLGEYVAEDEVELGHEVFHEIRRAVVARCGWRLMSDDWWGRHVDIGVLLLMLGAVRLTSALLRWTFTHPLHVHLFLPRPPAGSHTRATYMGSSKNDVVTLQGGGSYIIVTTCDVGKGGGVKGCVTSHFL